MLEGKVIGTWELKATLKFWWYVKTKQECKKEAKVQEMKIQLLRWEKATQKSKLRVEKKNSTKICVLHTKITFFKH